MSLSIPGGRCSVNQVTRCLKTCTLILGSYLGASRELASWASYKVPTIASCGHQGRVGGDQAAFVSPQALLMTSTCFWLSYGSTKLPCFPAMDLQRGQRSEDNLWWLSLSCVVCVWDSGRQAWKQVPWPAGPSHWLGSGGIFSFNSFILLWKFPVF